MKYIVLLCFLLFSCNTYKEKVAVIDGTIQIEQNGQIISGYDNYFNISDNKFNMIISNAKNYPIQIFAYHNNEMFSKYQYPVKDENTVMFHPATALINDSEENKEITLYINKEMQHNYISLDKRINENGTAIIKIKDIADIDNKFNGTLYLTIFIDYNKNGIIEQNEIANLSVFINKSNNTILFKSKAYVSTMGYWLSDIQRPVYGNNYFYVKITSEYEKYRFLELFGKDHYDRYDETTFSIGKLDCSKHNMYIIFSPITTEIVLYDNPYHYSGDFKLIFDININKNSNKGRYVFARNYRVEKSNDKYEIWINNFGGLIKLKQMALYEQQ